MSRYIFVELRFMGQGYENHLTKKVFDIMASDRDIEKRPMNIYVVVMQSMDPKILHHLYAYKACFKFWTYVKSVYTNNIQNNYKVVSNIVHVSNRISTSLLILER